MFKEVSRTTRRERHAIIRSPTFHATLCKTLTYLSTLDALSRLAYHARVEISPKIAACLTSREG